MAKNPENKQKSPVNSLDRVCYTPSTPQIILKPQGSVLSVPEPGELILPGSFNPLHDGHLEMASVATRKLGRACWFELSIVNADKNRLADSNIANRLNQDFREFGLVLTHAATFAEKSALFPGAIFVVGADTIIRIGDLKYYGSDQGQFDQAIRQIEGNGCQFLIFGRKVANKFIQQQNISLCKNLMSMCRFVDRVEFENDLS